MKKKTYNENKRNWFLAIGAAITILMVLLIVMGYFWTPYEPNAMNGACQFQPPSLAHMLGTDNFGRDIWTRTWEGARVSLLIAVAAAIIDMIIGMCYGLISGYFGGKTDMVMQRILEVANSIPRLVICTLLLLVLKLLNMEKLINL